MNGNKKLTPPELDCVKDGNCYRVQRKGMWCPKDTDIMIEPVRFGAGENLKCYKLAPKFSQNTDNTLCGSLSGSNVQCAIGSSVCNQLAGSAASSIKDLKCGANPMYRDSNCMCHGYQRYS